MGAKENPPVGAKPPRDTGLEVTSRQHLVIVGDRMPVLGEEPTLTMAEFRQLKALLAAKRLRK